MGGRQCLPFMHNSAQEFFFGGFLSFKWGFNWVVPFWDWLSWFVLEMYANLDGCKLDGSIFHIYSNGTEVLVLFLKKKHLLKDRCSNSSSIIMNSWMYNNNIVYIIIIHSIYMYIYIIFWIFFFEYNNNKKNEWRMISRQLLTVYIYI